MNREAKDQRSLTCLKYSYENFFTLTSPSLGFICCGHEYINSSTTLCCVGNEGYPTMHPAGNATMTLQCCGSNVIRQEEKCCTGIGYDPQRHVCADRPTSSLPIQVCLWDTKPHEQIYSLTDIRTRKERLSIKKTYLI